MHGGPDSLRGRKVDAGGGLVSQWRGGEATRDGADKLGGGAGRQRHAEQTKKKNGKKGSEVGGRRLLKALGARCGEGKGGGSARCRMGAGEGAGRGQGLVTWASKART
jgi:hypothetical protein